MKQFKDRQGKGKELKAPARYKSLMVSKDNLSDGTFKTMMDAGVKQMLVKQPETVPSRLKASVSDMPMKHMKQELATPDEYEGLSKAEKKALIKLRKKERRGTKPEKKARKEARKKAEVAPIIKETPPVVAPVSGTDDEVTGCDLNKQVTVCDPVKPAKLSRRQRRKAAKALKDAKKATESQGVTDAEQIKKLEEIVEGDDTAANEERALIGPPQQEPVAPEPDTPVKTEKKDSVKPQLTVVPTGNEPKIIGKIHHFGSSKALGKTVPIQSELPASPRKTRGYTNLARKSDAAEASGNDEHVATTPVEVVDTELYGTCIRDTGSGMTPSGMPISDFLVGGKYPPPSKSQGVTPSNSDYTYEEMGELLDTATLDLHKQKVYYEDRLRRGVDRENTMLKTIDHQRSALAVSGFHQSTSAASDSEVVVELQDMNTLLTEDNDALREELDKQADRYDQVAVQAHHMQSDGTFKKVSVNSKATMNTLELQYEIFCKQYNEDPMRSFFRSSGYPLKLMKELKDYRVVMLQGKANAATFHQYVMRPEIQVYRDWTKREFKLLRCFTRGNTQLEQDAIKRIGNKLRLQTVTVIDTDCNKLAKQDGRVWYSHQPVESATYQEVWKDIPTQTRLGYDTELWDGVATNREDARLKRLSKTTTFKVLKPLHKGLKTVKKALGYELIPSKRKALAEHNIAEGIKASGIKRQREAAFEKEINADVVTEAKKDKAVNESGFQLENRGFILPDGTL